MLRSLSAVLIVSVAALAGSFGIGLLYYEVTQHFSDHTGGLPVLAGVATVSLLLAVTIGLPFATLWLARQTGGELDVAALVSILTTAASVLLLAGILSYANACRFSDGWPLGATCQ
jgi:hypothetical protein